jgi:hypothetical protein
VLWWLAHEHQVGDRHAPTITDAMKVGTNPDPVLLQFNVQEGEEMLARRRFLRAVVLDALRGES